jgi:hypothetical protein
MLQSRPYSDCVWVGLVGTCFNIHDVSRGGQGGEYEQPNIDLNYATGLEIMVLWPGKVMIGKGSSRMLRVLR